MAYRSLLFLLLLAAGVAWAADEVAAPVDREPVVKQRAVERWAALIKRDYAAAYQFENPAYRAANTLQQFSEEFGEDVVWEKVEADQVLFEGDDVALVYLKMRYQAAKHVAEWAPVISTSLTEKWIFSDRQWWHVFPPRKYQFGS